MILFVRPHHFYMSEQKYEFLFKNALSGKSISKITSSELTKYAILIAISVNLEKVPTEEQEAFHKVYTKYKKIVAEESEKTKWLKAYSEVAERLRNIDQSSCISSQEEEKKCENKHVLITPEQQEFMEHYAEIYTQLQ